MSTDDIRELMSGNICRCGAYPNIVAAIKQAMVNASERDTKLIFRTLHNTARVFKNAISEEVTALEGRPGGCEFKDVVCGKGI